MFVSVCGLCGCKRVSLLQLLESLPFRGAARHLSILEVSGRLLHVIQKTCFIEIVLTMDHHSGIISLIFQVLLSRSSLTCAVRVQVNAYFWSILTPQQDLDWNLSNFLWWRLVQDSIQGKIQPGLRLLLRIYPWARLRFWYSEFPNPSTVEYPLNNGSLPIMTSSCCLWLHMLSFEEQHHIGFFNLFVCLNFPAANDILLLKETIQEKFGTQALGWESNLSLLLEWTGT